MGKGSLYILVVIPMLTPNYRTVIGSSLVGSEIDRCRIHDPKFSRQIGAQQIRSSLARLCHVLRLAGGGIGIGTVGHELDSHKWHTKFQAQPRNGIELVLLDIAFDP